MGIIFQNRQVILYREWERASLRAMSFMESELRQSTLRDKNALSQKERSRRAKKRKQAKASRRGNR